MHIKSGYRYFGAVLKKFFSARFPENASQIRLSLLCRSFEKVFLRNLLKMYLKSGYLYSVAVLKKFFLRDFLKMHLKSGYRYFIAAQKVFSANSSENASHPVIATFRSLESLLANSSKNASQIRLSLLSCSFEKIFSARFSENASQIRLSLLCRSLESFFCEFL